MPFKKKVQDPPQVSAEAVSTPKVETKPEASVGATELANALITAINATKPIEKKNPFNRKVLTPWTPKDGSKKLKLKRKMYQHGLLIKEETTSNEEIALLNKVRPGRFLNGFVAVIRRKDRGVDIDYPIKTASQRLKLVNQYGIRNLSELLQRCILEAESPKKPETDEFGDAL